MANAHRAYLMTKLVGRKSQIAGIEALRGPQKSVDAMRAEFQKRRDVMVAGLNKIKGFSCRLPKGAFYVFPTSRRTRWPSKKLADALLDDAGVAGLSGTASAISAKVICDSAWQTQSRTSKSARSRKRLGQQELVGQPPRLPLASGAPALQLKISHLPAFLGDFYYTSAGDSGLGCCCSGCAAVFPTGK